MNRNSESHFGAIPNKDIRRSKFKRDCSHKTTFNTGDLIPIYVDEVLPGDTVKMNCASLVRMLTPINPTMDNAWLDIYFYFVPRRLTWEHWQEFMGENTYDAWTDPRSFTIPQLTAPSGGWTKGSLGEKIYGVQGIDNISVDAQYMRSYVAIVNEWFRNQNVTEMAHMSTGDSTTAGSNGTSYVTDLEKGGAPFKVVKYADYFTRALPAPQKGPDIYIPLGNANLQVLTDTEHKYAASALNPNAMTGRVLNRGLNTLNTGTTYGSVYPTAYLGTNQSIPSKGFATSTANATEYVGSSQGQANYGYVPDNLYVSTNNLIGPSINELRQAFAIQRMYELDARGGRAKACASSIKKSRKKTGKLNRKAS